MSEQDIQNEERTVVLARLEGVYGQDSIAANLPGALATDAFLVSAADYKVNATILDRGNYNPSLSPDKKGTGRMLAEVTFTHELKASGTLGTASRLGRLLRACGYAETAITAGASTQISNAAAGPLNVSTDSAAIASGITKTTAPSANFDTYRITCTTGGAQGTAKFAVTSMGFPEGDSTVLPSTTSNYWTNSVAGVVTLGGSIKAPTFTFSGTWAAGEAVIVYAWGLRFYYQVQTGDDATAIATAVAALIAADTRLASTASALGVVTVGGVAEVTSSGSGTTAVTLGSSGAAIAIPTFGGTLSVGDYWEVTLRRVGVRYDPVSDNMDSLTIYMYMDGKMYKTTGARGTATSTGTGGDYPKISFTFQGVYYDAIDDALPGAGLVYEASKPYKVELAQLSIAGFSDAIAQQFTFDLGNTLTPRDNINASEAYDAIRITKRQAKFGCNPESRKPSVYDPWQEMRQERPTRVHVAVGIRGGAGNIVRVQGDCAMYDTSPTFSNRNNIRAYAFSFGLQRVSDAGNDEVSFTFC